MLIALKNLIDAIHQSPGKIELSVTGGGSSAIGLLLEVPGASGTLLNACVPYSHSALENYVGHAVEHACSELTARAMAGQAYLSALNLSADHSIGIGATAALQTHRQRRGSDRLHVATMSQSTLTTYLLELDSEQTRSQQEHACATFIIQCIAQSVGISESVPPEIATTPVPTNQQNAEPEWQSLFTGKSDTTSSLGFKGIFPGAFNPPHEGHTSIRRIAERKLGGSVAFELSIHNVDKPPLDYIDMAQRAKLIEGHPLIFTRAATFSEKSRIFSDVCFVVGIDTLTRIDDPKYYGASLEARDQAIQAIAKRGNRFLVFGRESQGQFLNLGNVKVSAALRNLCDSVDEEEFRLDISSTELRK